MEIRRPPHQEGDEGTPYIMCGPSISVPLHPALPIEQAVIRASISLIERMEAAGVRVYLDMVRQVGTPGDPNDETLLRILENILEMVQEIEMAREEVRRGAGPT